MITHPHLMRPNTHALHNIVIVDRVTGERRPYQFNPMRTLDALTASDRYYRALNEATHWRFDCLPLMWCWIGGRNHEIM